MSSIVNQWEEIQIGEYIVLLEGPHLGNHEA